MSNFFRTYSHPYLIKAEFSLSDLKNMENFSKDHKADELYLFMNDLTYFNLQNYFKILGSSGIQSTKLDLGNRTFERVTKVMFGLAKLWLIPQEIFDHPALYKSGDVPSNKEIFIVTPQNHKRFLKELTKIENKYI